MLLIYSEHITPRVEYVFQFLLEEINGFTIRLTADKNEFYSFDGPSLNYSNASLKVSEVYIKPNGFLFASEMEPCKVNIEKTKEHIRLFIHSKNSNSSFFDPFAAAFYLLSRYEEYFAYTPDAFNRFEANSSVLYQYQLLEIPLIDKWGSEIKNKILTSFPQLDSKRKDFNSLITIDIDQAYAFKGRGIKRNLFSFTKNLFYFQSDWLGWQLKSVFKNKDPYDTYYFLKEIQLKTGLPFIYFINAGKYSKYDKNLPAKNAGFQKLLRDISAYAFTGLHPSFFSNEAPSKFSKEKDMLEKIISKPVKKSRQHYLKLKLPQTYRNLIAAGIEEDYSMGYATHPGFRAGTCTPFFWFDLEKNEITKLKVFSITYMEGSLGEDLKMTPEEAEKKINSLVQVVKQYNGCHICVWHNHTVNDCFFWKGWKAVFEATINNLNNRIEKKDNRFSY